MPNRLATEQSPYLLQHANNPVDWYPWCDEAFEKAKAENKPVIVSIGYAACHWCHVMERESFEKEEVAAYMNAHFINIKVDREEHPGVDHLYMDAVQALTGAGGWPLNVFVTFDRMPFYGGTYFPPHPAYNRPSWLQLMQRMNDVWTTQADEVVAQSEQMKNYLLQTGMAPGIADAQVIDAAACNTMADALLRNADKEWGGFGAAPKFPGTMSISYLLEHDHYFPNPEARAHALLSLDKMMEGGIYDQLGGGFARYSTDREWLAPHFEKMLYDNALLVLSLCDAWQATGENKYRVCIEETIAFCNRELRHFDGGFYSALDADSEGVEGKFYTWTWEEWLAALENEPVGVLAAKHFGVQPGGNWEETNILHINTPVEELAKQENIDGQVLQEQVNALREMLFKIRSIRIRPQTDDKSLLSWNALMNLALSKAGIALRQQEHLDQAKKHMDWMLQAFYQDETLLHTWKDGVARIAAHLDDYAYLLQALLQLANATGDEHWIVKANELLTLVLRDFSDEASGFFFYTNVTETDIPVRKVEIYDGATPSANALMAHNLVLLGLLMERNDWLERGNLMTQRMAGNALRYPSSFAWWAQLLQRGMAGWKTIVTTGPEAVLLHQQITGQWLPEIIGLPLHFSGDSLVTIVAEKATMTSQDAPILICTDLACLPPQRNFEAAIELLRPV